LRGMKRDLYAADGERYRGKVFIGLSSEIRRLLAGEGMGEGTVRLTGVASIPRSSIAFSSAIKTRA